LNGEFQKDVKALRVYLKRVSAKNIPVMFALIGKIMSFYIFVVSDAFVDARPAARKSRKLSEGILYEADARIETFLKKKLRTLRIDAVLAHFLTISEIKLLLGGKRLATKAIDIRKAGYVLFNDTLLPGADFKTYCAKHGLINPEYATQQQVRVLKGVCAYRGHVCGAVKIVKDRNSFAKVERGDVVVAVMTNILYVPILRKAAAFITDEGGIMCHAAIAARELRKPCIVGTKMATQVLKDGDVVEVNAKHGTIKILK
jgi:phosphohistidine swiveling domain-containing protein